MNQPMILTKMRGMANSAKTRRKPSKTPRPGRTPFSPLVRSLQTLVSLRPYHRYVFVQIAQENAASAPRKNSGLSHAVHVAIEEAAQRRGISEEDFLQMPEAEKYVIGHKD